MYRISCQCIEYFSYKILNEETFESTRHLLKGVIKVDLGGKNCENMNWSSV